MQKVTTPKKLSLSWLLISAAVVIALAIGFAYLNHPADRTAQSAAVSQEAKAYLPNLELSDVGMKATENLMRQQLVEIVGRIGNKGPRPIRSIDVTCIFYGADGKEVYRERVPVVRLKADALKGGETRSFRLPFDNLPESWNQSMPRLVIAQLAFAQ